MKFFKHSDNLEFVDITRSVKIGKFFKKFFLLIGLFFLCLYGSTFLKEKSVIIQEFLIVDTIDLSNQDTFMLSDSLTEKAVLTYFCFLNVSHPYESTAQILLESGRLKNNWTKERNNLGAYQTRQGYLFFPHWTDCVRFAKRWQISHGLKKSYNFYQWLNTTPYHESDKSYYNSQVRSIEIELRRKYQLRQILTRIKK